MYIENISNIIPPTYSMTQDGDTVIVILTTLNNHGCVQGTDSVQVITIADPVAHFVVDTTQGCHPFTIQTDTTAISSNGIYTWIVSRLMETPMIVLLLLDILHLPLL